MLYLCGLVFYEYRVIPERKGGRCLGLTTLPYSCVDSLEILGTSNIWSSNGLCRPVNGLLFVALFYCTSSFVSFKTATTARNTSLQRSYVKHISPDVTV